jgi:DNA-binding transcriptional regulator LsrR (DeoR family)
MLNHGMTANEIAKFTDFTEEKVLRLIESAKKVSEVSETSVKYKARRKTTKPRK